MKHTIALATLFAIAASTPAPAALAPETRKVVPLSSMGHEKGTMGIAPDNYRTDILLTINGAKQYGDIQVAGNCVRLLRNASFPQVAVDMIKKTGLQALLGMDEETTLAFVEKVQKHIEAEFCKREKARAIFDMPAPKAP